MTRKYKRGSHGYFVTDPSLQTRTPVDTSTPKGASAPPSAWSSTIPSVVPIAVRETGTTMVVLGAFWHFCGTVRGPKNAPPQIKVTDPRNVPIPATGWFPK
ncbi:MAG: hypothetical protein LBG27_02530 [Spirochaetaceae bacterium]|nr:hypothetical protein [Spirochaetaceae bacterium]